MKIKYIFLICLLFLVCGCAKNEENKVIPEYDHDIKCVSHIEEEKDGDLETYTSNIFIKLDDNSYVKSAIYQSISESTLLDKSTLELTNQFLNIYKDIKGIEASSDVIDNKLVITIKYTYSNIDLINVKKKLGSILDDNHIFKKVNKLPFSYDEYKKYELNNYECK